MSTRGSGSPVESLTSSLPVGAVAGAIAFVVNYVGVYLFLTVDGYSPDNGEMWKSAGRILFQSQFVATEASGSGQSLTYNLVTGDSSNQLMQMFVNETDVTSTIPSAIYHLLPIVVLVAVGFVVYKASGSKGDVASAAAAGASVAVGYLALSLVGYFLFQNSYNGADYAPELLPALLLAGLAYPLVSGAIGGAIGQQTD